jgi:hypothetical protein
MWSSSWTVCGDFEPGLNFKPCMSKGLKPSQKVHTELSYSIWLRLGLSACFSQLTRSWKHWADVVSGDQSALWTPRNAVDEGNCYMLASLTWWLLAQTTFWSQQMSQDWKASWIVHLENALKQPGYACRNAWFTVDSLVEMLEPI